MTNIDLKLPRHGGYQSYTGHLLLGFLLLFYALVRSALIHADPAGVTSIEAIWLLVITSALVFTGLLAVCWLLMKHGLTALGLPSVNRLIIYFEHLESWQKLGFYMAVFGLLLLAAIGCLLAIC